jgi:hypothetical protein
VSLLDVDLLGEKMTRAFERVVPVRITASDHERLAVILRTELEDPGAMITMGDVLGWTMSARAVETHVQIAPHDEGSKIRLVIRGAVKDRPKLWVPLGLAVGLAVFIAALMAGIGAHGARVPLYVIAPLVIMPLLGWWERRTYDRRVLHAEAAVDALAKALVEGPRVPRTRVEAIDDDALERPLREARRR